MTRITVTDYGDSALKFPDYGDSATKFPTHPDLCTATGAGSARLGKYIANDYFHEIRHLDLRAK